MKHVVFVNTSFVACGGHAMGLNLWRILQTSKQFDYSYLIPESCDHLMSEVAARGAGVILNNHLTVAQPWLTVDVIKRIASTGVKHVALLSHGSGYPGFDANLMPDPTIKQHGNTYPIGRPLPAVTNVPAPKNEVATIGTAGHLLPHKQFHNTVSRVIAEFDHAHIRMLIGRADLAPYELPDAIECKRLVDECGKDIRLTLITENMPLPQLVDWLAGNDLNVYLYGGGDGGTAPAFGPDPALSARRPIAVSRNEPVLALFHSCQPSVCVEDNSLKTILENGCAPLQPLYDRFSDERVLADVENVLKEYSQ